tara:strand:+ start:2628 stop:2894 length:267 start_codon:yes stop_codon:yes gene_type:complete
MDIVVAKGRDFSFSDVERLRTTDKGIDVQILFIHPSGIISDVRTNKGEFMKLEMLKDSIVYGEEYLFDLYALTGWNDEPLDESYKSLE